MSCEAEAIRDEERDQRERADVGAWGVQRHGGDAAQQRHLGDQEPSATPAEERRRVAIHEARPQELPRVGLLHQRDQPERGEAHVLHRGPRLEGGGDQRDRQARGEPEEEEHRELAIAEKDGISGVAAKVAQG